MQQSLQTASRRPVLCVGSKATVKPETNGRVGKKRTRRIKAACAQTARRPHAGRMQAIVVLKSPRRLRCGGGGKRRLLRRHLKIAKVQSTKVMLLISRYNIRILISSAISMIRFCY